MKRQNRFLIALLSAGITFATLTATIGTDHWKRGYYGHHGYWHHYDHHYNHDQDHDNLNNGDPENGGKEDTTSSAGA